MKKIINPYKSTENGKCFGCSPDNEQGLQMQFFEQDEYIISEWDPKSHLSGFKNILHGGIQTTILDEIACWVVFVKCQTAGVTTALNAKFKNSAFTDKGKLTVRAKLISQERKFANIHAEIIGSDGKVCSEAEVQYMIFPQALAIKKFEYPGIEAFYE
ncbi:PaaI family thioesterase [Marinifilum sp. N1E240]|uniref:PaaI family thioesterase n=1 Tax=Marinifilum sp. N1E240 TaxID=2608082 RepID=UPI00128BDDCD|nr:PaaI family thioesterase [Marinifilum sp. N1E240]MPQ45660.1 PaaI family thioesterase [Marinifilum sp. N1E240]